MKFTRGKVKNEIELLKKGSFEHGLIAKIGDDVVWIEPVPKDGEIADSGKKYAYGSTSFIGAFFIFEKFPQHEDILVDIELEDIYLLYPRWRYKKK